MQHGGDWGAERGHLWMKKVPLNRPQKKGQCNVKRASKLQRRAAVYLVFNDSMTLTQIRSDQISSAQLSSARWPSSSRSPQSPHAGHPGMLFGVWIVHMPHAPVPSSCIRLWGGRNKWERDRWGALAPAWTHICWAGACKTSIIFFMLYLKISFYPPSWSSLQSLHLA